jgi:hypothetical protein
MKLVCPNCSSPILAENINISTDLAKCVSCNSIHKASELADQSSIEKLQNPPPGTKITIKKGLNDSFELFLPKPGFKPSMIFQFIFTIFWVGFVGFWTFMAAKGSIFFAMFSIPFWLVGIGMLTGLINSIYETQTLILSKTNLVLKKNRPVRSKTFEISLNEIQSIKMKNMKMNNPFSMFGNFKMMFKMQKSFGMGGLELPAIISGYKTEYFFEDANDAEQEWVTSSLDSIIKRLKK